VLPLPSLVSSQVQRISVNNPSAKEPLYLRLRSQCRFELVCIEQLRIRSYKLPTILTLVFVYNRVVDIQDDKVLRRFLKSKTLAVSGVSMMMLIFILS